MKPSVEAVLKALDALNSGNATRKHKDILEAVGGTQYDGREFTFALDPEVVALRIQSRLSPGQVVSRLRLGPLAAADYSGKALGGKQAGIHSLDGDHTSVKGSLRIRWTKHRTG